MISYKKKQYEPTTTALTPIAQNIMISTQVDEMDAEQATGSRQRKDPAAAGDLVENECSKRKEEGDELSLLQFDSPVLRKRFRKISKTLERPHSMSPSIVPPPTIRVARSLSVTTIRPPDEAAHELALPVIQCHKLADLNVIEPSTVQDLVDGVYRSKLERFHLIDCRFGYEYQGGSLQDAVSLTLPDETEQFLFNPVHSDSTRTALVFYCEFSSYRAPKMARHVRNLDRWMHADTYPELYYPELYIVQGGYKHCFDLQAALSQPRLYTQMQDKRYADDCKRCMAQLRLAWKQHKGLSCSDRFLQPLQASTQ